LLDNLVIDPIIQPPILKKQAGRPKTKRIRKGAWKRKQTRCSTCLDWGHNKGTCRNQPISSGRRERAREWLEEVIVKLRDLEDNEEGYISSELSDLNDLDIEEVQEVQEVQEIVEGRVTRSSGRII